jgi:hypothetical protein
MALLMNLTSRLVLSGWIALDYMASASDFPIAAPCVPVRISDITTAAPQASQMIKSDRKAINRDGQDRQDKRE